MRRRIALTLMRRAVRKIVQTLDSDVVVRLSSALFALGFLSAIVQRVIAALHGASGLSVATVCLMAIGLALKTPSALAWLRRAYRRLMQDASDSDVRS